MGDDIPLAGLIGLIVVLLMLSAFFSGSETALMSLNRYQLRHKAKQGNRGAKLAEHLLKRPDRLLGLILLGNNLVNFSAASLVGVAAFQIGGQPAVAVGTLVLTLTVLIFAETAPKTLAALHPERLAFPAALIYYPLLKITYPIVWLTNVASNGVLFLCGVRGDGADKHTLTREELRTVVNEAGIRMSPRYRQMLLSILDLEKVTVDDVMVPHNEIVGIDLDDEEEEIYCHHRCQRAYPPSGVSRRHGKNRRHSALEKACQPDEQATRQSEIAATACGAILCSGRNAAQHAARAVPTKA